MSLGYKPDKIWIDKNSEFYNRFMKSWLQDNAIEMYSTDNQGRSFVSEGLIRTLRNKIYTCMTLTSKNVYINKLVDIPEQLQ